MIEIIYGILVKKTPIYSVVDVNGIGYRITCTLNCYEKLPELKSKVSFLIHFHISDNSQELYGFLDDTEMDLFKMLIGISGIGPKTAINILSAVPPNEFKNRLIAGEVKLLTSLPGIGPKTARRIIVELKDEFGKFDSNELPVESSLDEHDAFYALKNLGFAPKSIRKAISEVLSKNKTLNTEEIVRLSLKLLK